MGTKAYKYLRSASVEKVSAEAGTCAFKCSYPRDFNDPYELFLTVDYEQDPEVPAYYHEVIGAIPQLATTCFSKSPEVVPMWAHYAENHTGVVIEVDEDCVLERYPEIAFGDVDYRDGADPDILKALHHAIGTKKPRHTYIVQKAVLSAAYYTKLLSWSYEQERRLLARPEETVTVDGNVLVRMPIRCVTSLIVGFRATAETKSAVKELSARNRCRYLEMKVGRTRAKPFFVDEKGNVWVFEGGQFIESASVCESCGEPIHDGKDQCSWCAMTPEDADQAARQNPMRMLANYELLEGYYRDMAEIDRRHRKPK